MQLGFERWEVWTLLYQRLLPLTSLPPPYTSHKLHDISFKLVFKTWKPFTWFSHQEKTTPPCSAKSIRRPLLPIEYLEQKKDGNLYLSSSPAPNQGQEISTFWLLCSFILDLSGGGGCWGWVGLLFHFVLSKIVVKITVGWVVRGKICIGQWASPIFIILFLSQLTLDSTGVCPS